MPAQLWDWSIRIRVAFLLFPEIFEVTNFVLDDGPFTYIGAGGGI